MAVVKLNVKWEFQEIADAEALEVISVQIDRFARYSFECCLREIAECSLQRKVFPGVESKRAPMRMGMVDNALGMTLHVAGVSMQDGSELETVDVDKIEMILRGDLWKLIHS